jgi:hypothetical protein
MTENEILTLNQFFSSEQEPSMKRLTKTEEQDNLAEIKKLISDKAKVLWPLACDFIFKKLMGALDDNISDIMIEAWGKYKEIIEYADVKKHPPDEANLVPLDEHTISTEYNPEIEITFKNIPLTKTIHFNITVSLIVNGIILEIQGGKIMKVNIGTCKGSGSIKCEGFEILKKETSPFTLAGPIDLGQGITIPNPLRL